MGDRPWASSRPFTSVNVPPLSKLRLEAPSRGGVRRSHDFVNVLVDQRSFALSRLAPQHEDDGALTVAEHRDDRVGELAPFLRVRVGFGLAHRESGVEEKDALSGPCTEVAVGRRREPVPDHRRANVAHRRRRLRKVPWDREAQSGGLARLMVRILSQDDDLDLLVRREAESREDVAGRRVDGTFQPFTVDEPHQLREVRFGGLLAQHVRPWVLYAGHCLTAGNSSGVTSQRFHCEVQRIGRRADRVNIALIRHDQCPADEHLVGLGWVAVVDDPHVVLLAPRSMNRHEVRPLGTQVGIRLLLPPLALITAYPRSVGSRW